MTTDTTESLEIRSTDGARARAARLAARAARLVVVHPTPDLVPLTDKPLELGRERLGHGSVSRHHLTIIWQRGQHLVADPGSKNGTWLDGRRLDATPRALEDQAVIRAGGVVMVYEAGGMAAVDDDDDDPALLQAIPGRSGAAEALRAGVRRMAADPAPVLVIGETGAGKERVASELHRLSKRAGPFVAVNVAELSERLVESQLFGHVRGAFTGADAAQPGLFREAHKGTLLLDEIGELPLELQAKLLRVIQEREVRPVGATRTEKVDVRIIAATHADLLARVEDQSFRRDLWARLSLLELIVKPLSDRRADILELLQRLHDRWRGERRQPTVPLRFEPDAVEHLLLRAWPENLRGLDRLVHRLPADLPMITVEAIEAAIGPASPPDAGADREAAASSQPPPAPPQTADELRAALETHGSVHALARHYGKDRRQIYRWLEAFGLKEKR
ncbi:MAG: sigma-54-dependent Fis family transcriptional regulator [Deltaproteobacteria bacterium]|nr:sigma-54-dependent Fis family transcriptional regulator [Deltaproteobacteria bacterium]